MTMHRREFLKATGVGAAALPLASLVNPLRDKTLRIGLVGCGGRGTSAAMQALNADKDCVLYSLGDLFPDRLASSLSGLTENYAERIQVEESRQHVGFDAFQKVVEEVDVVLFATPPAFRPAHLKAAVKAGCHVFCEKPVAVDAPGVRSVLETAAAARAKGLSMASGFCWRSALSHRAIYGHIHAGALGPVRHIYGNYMAGGLWSKQRQSGWTDLEFQLRNWLYYTALSGDHLVEQAVHSVDKILWAKRDQPPARAIGVGGRQVRTEAIFGHIYDHFGITYEWEDGCTAQLQCRQQNGTHMENIDRIVCADGVAHVDGWAGNYRFEGAKEWVYDGPGNNMYQTEHDELFESIRNGGGLNQGVSMAYSTLAAIMGRMAAYTGQRITWDQAMNSEEKLTPERWEFGPGLAAEVAMPGKTKFH